MVIHFYKPFLKRTASGIVKEMEGLRSVGIAYAFALFRIRAFLQEANFCFLLSSCAMHKHTALIAKRQVPAAATKPLSENPNKANTQAVTTPKISTLFIIKPSFRLYILFLILLYKKSCPKNGTDKNKLL